MRNGTVSQPGRHRLGTPGLIHCVRFPRVTQLLAMRQQRWVSVLFNPTRRGLTSPRQHSVPAERTWGPTAVAA